MRGFTPTVHRKLIDLTHTDTIGHNRDMTDFARSLSALEANGTTGMMMPVRAVMCCRMCR
ncbi:hypothetical protein FHX48_000339 [Microbacterium halimionae]|uniref:Uncharacterized protein n=1 Tax=Microbacterium halimionae TaxID=1526413 RepID=A0A7W3JLY7_9MICO|nr:hypothetical protein [Microbacterium halimionae]NII93922.1 hypothetical protein [Microbacterium halimionae]